MSFQNAPYLIDWAITNKCNLHCRHCRGMHEGELSTKRALSLVDEIAELKPGWVIIEGGEPLLREDFFPILERMRKRHLPVHVISNGMLLTPAILSALKNLEVKIMISVDGANQETYESIRIGADFETVIRQVKNCAQRGLLESINFAVLKRNYTEIPQVFSLAKSLGIPKINFIGLKPCHNYTEELLTAAEYLEAISLACRCADAEVDFFFDEPFFRAVVNHYGLPIPKQEETAGILAGATTACIFGEYLFIEPDGVVKPCSFSPMHLRNVKDASILAIWDEINTSDFFKKMKDASTRTGACSDCEYLLSCKGCRSRTYVITGDWFASDPCCPLLNKQRQEK